MGWGGRGGTGLGSTNPPDKTRDRTWDKTSDRTRGYPPPGWRPWTGLGGTPCGQILVKTELKSAHYL